MQVWMYLLLDKITWLVSEARQTVSLDSSGTANHETRPCGSLRKLVRQQVQDPPERPNHVIQILCSYWLANNHVSWQQCIDICRHILKSRVGSRTRGFGSDVTDHILSLPSSDKCLVERCFRQVPADRK